MNKQHWIFDMDGTLTIPMHNFDQMKSVLGLPNEKPLLESAKDLPEPKREQALQKIADWEYDLATQAKASQDAKALLEHLFHKGKHLAILTRNIRSLALITLRAAGLIQFFDTDVVLGRDCAPPKPSPQGVLAIIQHWNTTPEETVMVGDFHFDIEAGFKAGASTIQVLRTPTLIHSNATIVLKDLGDLIL